MPDVVALVGTDRVPAPVRSPSTIAEPDYVDCFTVSTGVAADRPAEEWLRAILEESALARRHARRLWRLLGLRLGPRGSPAHVQGWRIADVGDDWVRASTGSWYLTGEVVCVVADGGVSLSLVLRFDRPPARAVWAVVAGPHQRAVPTMLREAVEVMASRHR